MNLCDFLALLEVVSFCTIPERLSEVRGVFSIALAALFVSSGSGGES